jgi:hypothetical protein
MGAGASDAETIVAIDPVLFSESILIDAAPEFVYDLVTDIGRTGEWSPICRTCWWKNEQGARTGAWFLGRNEADGQVWETESQVTVADRGREFAWLVGGRYARWGYRLEPVGGGSRLTESWEFLPATLAAIKRIARTENAGTAFRPAAPRGTRVCNDDRSVTV